ncbi:transmembrane protein 26-like [Ptychodera flava]|uniref:transmembrane protein 26-like n=1 Tax=Ptychodera flava TaxID=63121 RepID=UPI00396A6E29
MLETELMDQRIDYKEINNLTSCDADSGDVYTNSTGLSDFHGVSVPLSLTDDYWVLALEQFLMCILIVGRWFLPKGDMTREQLSTLLLVYIGMASDILEFVLEGLKEPEVKCNVTLVYVILSIWSLSMLQFAIVLTASGERDNVKTKRCCAWNTEIRGILITSFMQDAPFLVVRLLLLIHYRVVNHMMLFFTCKNSVMLMLQSYRLIVIITENQNSVTPVNGDVEDANKNMALEDVTNNGHMCRAAKLKAPRV